jgi:Ca-activated chloride channel family protein
MVIVFYISIINRGTLERERGCTMKTRLLFAFLIIMGVSIIVITPVKADGIIIPVPPICDPCPIPSPMSQLVIRYHHVTVIIEDQVATTHVDQVFYNPNDWAVEGEYVFPIPFDAAVSDFILWMDGVPVQGEILDADQARRKYEEIVANLRDPALLEYAEMGALRARVFPIPPQGERRIELEYSQVLTVENGLVRYIYPLGTEKFSMEPLEDVSVTVKASSNQPIRAVYSPSHPISINREDDYHLLAGYEEQDVLPDKDFTLFYSIGETEAFHLLTYRDPTDLDDPDGFFLLLLAPSVQQNLRAVPKDVLLVLDRSGSMDGEKFIQAQDAVRFILEKLNPDDRFNLITFSTGVEMYASKLRPASEAEEAQPWVNRLRAEGSTDINRALLEAAFMVDQERPTYLIFLTDGLPTVGEVDNQRIIDNFGGSAPSNLSLFAFGVGYDVDTYLLDSLAQAHHGNSTYVVPGEQLDEILSAFYSKISAPVLTDLNLDFGDLITYDIYPHPLPDLFIGSQIAITGRYRDGGTADVTLTGSVNNYHQTYAYRDQIFDIESFNRGGTIAYLPRLWATRKIGYLLNQVRLTGPDKEVIDEIVRLSIRYGIVTPYTSYLVTEPLPLGAAEQERIAADEFNKFSEAAELPTFGRQAVEQAEGQNSLANSDTVVSGPVEAIGKVRVVGSHTFVYFNGQWTDTMFDPEQMETLKIAFLSDDYFTLAKTRSELANAFALGMNVIVVSGDVAYEVVDEDMSVDPLTINPISPTTEFDQPVPTIDVPTPDQPISTQPSNSTSSALPCWNGLIVAMLPLLTLGLVKHNAKDDRG